MTLLLFLRCPWLLFLMMRSQQQERVKQQQACSAAPASARDHRRRPASSARSSTSDEDEGTVILEIAPGTQIKMIRGAIARVVSEDEEYDEDGDEDDDDEVDDLSDDDHEPQRRTPTTPGPDPLVREDAVGTPHGAPIPDVPAVEPIADAAAITLGDVQSDPRAVAVHRLCGPGDGRDGVHRARVPSREPRGARSRTRCCAASGSPSARPSWPGVAGYLHDVGNALARDAHGQSGAMLRYQALRDRAGG